ncbi:hypothetical protein CY652_13070 [Burkholderia sp. WAC0059]|uniref:hypothetical protein n=1 Tax=Burkholderia sp. WAC0059 TaxID=2066022 RepID=UPI000C7EB30F|nr:hypothetical protein [Burkholderia sp. WAC0059]PLZ01956.1 hypothetical protein CY652_13070 [Burkholderia sp. WAC0059]
MTIGATTVTTSKIRIKLGAIEVEYEGSETFLKEELPALLSAVSDLYQRSQADGASDSDLPKATNPSTLNGSEGLKHEPLQGTTNTIAARLQVKKGPDLVLAAAARLALVQNLQLFSRQQVLDEMKSATQYFRPAHLNNLTRSLHGLVKDGKLNEPSKDNYALTAACKQELEARLAG